MDLQKHLKFIDVFSIAAGAMISSGIFILPGLAFSSVGPGVFISYFLAGVLAMLGILNVIELTTAMPRAGGDYYFVTRSMGPFVGTISGFFSWFALVLKSAFAIFGLAAVLATFVPSIPIGLSGAVFSAIFVGINLIGVKEAARFEVIMVFGLLAILAVFIIVGVPHIEVKHFEKLLLPGKSANAVLMTAGLVFISFGGLLNVASVSEEVENPGKNITYGIISSLVVVTFIYSIILVVTVGILKPDILSTSNTPLADAARISGGSVVYWLVTIGALLAFITTANAGIMSASRYPFALGRDRLIPEFITKESKKKGTPYVAIIITGICIALALQMKLDIMVKAASSVILASYVLSAFAVIILRESRVQNYRPTFRAPLYPALQIVGIILFSWLIFDMGLQAIEVTLVVIAISLTIYFIYGRKVSREYALLHLLERITNRKLTERELEQELKEVVHSREGVVKDRFDTLIEEARVLDLDDAMGTDRLFHQVAAEFSGDVGLSEEDMYTLLCEREQESSTAINDFVSIPHIILEGENIFKIFIVRNTAGIAMAQAEGKIRAAFVIIGTRDLRNLHLKSLAAIAQIVSDRKFEERWLKANSQEQLRDVLLLGKRKRNKAEADN